LFFSSLLGCGAAGAITLGPGGDVTLREEAAQRVLGQATVPRVVVTLPVIAQPCHHSNAPAIVLQIAGAFASGVDLLKVNFACVGATQDEDIIADLEFEFIPTGAEHARQFGAMKGRVAAERLALEDQVLIAPKGSDRRAATRPWSPPASTGGHDCPAAIQLAISASLALTNHAACSSALGQS
jgi:hypothetical protein